MICCRHLFSLFAVVPASRHIRTYFPLRYFQLYILDPLPLRTVAHSLNPPFPFAFRRVMSTGNRRGGRGKGGGGGGRGGKHRQPQSREVTVSKALSFLLRHGAKDEGVQLDEGGWANVRDVLLWRRLASMQVTFPELQTLVANNEKQRFSLEPLSSETLSPPAITTSTTSMDPSQYRIRASQGHTLTSISPSAIYTPLDPSDPTCPQLVVHGTDEKSWLKIKGSGGLKPMARTHIHFATALPKQLPPLDRQFQSKSNAKTEGDEVISGVRKTSTIFVWVDVEKSAREGGVEWWVSSNGVVLTKGVGGLLPLEWVRWVERRNGDVLFGVKDVQAEEEFLRRAEEAKKEGGKGLVAGIGEAPEGQGGGGGGEEDGGIRAEKENWDD